MSVSRPTVLPWPLSSEQAASGGPACPHPHQQSVPASQPVRLSGCEAGNFTVLSSQFTSLQTIKFYQQTELNYELGLHTARHWSPHSSLTVDCLTNQGPAMQMNKKLIKTWTAGRNG